MGDFISTMLGLSDNPIAVTQSSISDKEAICAAELALYLRDGSGSTHETPLDYWSKNMKRYELLTRLAQKYLCICASSVPCERLFSAAGLIYNDHRARLSPESVRYLTFLHQNYKLGNL